MKSKRNLIPGAFLFGIALLGGMNAHEAQAARSDNNPIVFSAVARDGDGFVRHNETLDLDCRLLERNTQNAVYSETHRLTSDAMGQVQIPLGDGAATAGDFSQVDFSQPLDLAVYEGAALLTRAPLSQVPAAAFAQQAEAARTATNALSAQTARVAETAQTAETAKTAFEAETARSALTAKTAEQATTAELAKTAETARSAEIAETAKTAENAISAQTAQTALRAQSAQAIEGLAFNDEAAPDQATIWSSAKVARLIGGQGNQGGQTALAKERAERIAEDLRLLDSIAAHRQDLNKLGDSVLALELRFNDSLVIVWDSIDALREALRQQIEGLETELGAINYCLVNDAEKGIYTAAIPLYDNADPETVGLFTNPILKVLRQNGNCDLFADLNLVAALKKSYRTRVMTYNTGGAPDNPKEVYIPASTAGLEVYVDNYRIDLPVTYYTYDALVFDVEFYYLGADVTPKLYVTLIRE